MNYLICYDIANEKRLQKIAKTVEQYGIRVQYSFFNVDMTNEALDSLLKNLLHIMNEKQDKIYVYPICSECKKNILIDGTGAFLSLDSYLVL
ncbi:MAG: CRISPR-associated endonuclease Cas2 [Bacteroidales bacterium]